MAERPRRYANSEKVCSRRSNTPPAAASPSFFSFLFSHLDNTEKQSRGNEKRIYVGGCALNGEKRKAGRDDLREDGDQ
jgi:hypothetical protein